VARVRALWFRSQALPNPQRIRAVAGVGTL
jgi:hypothetical protein